MFSSADVFYDFLDGEMGFHAKRHLILSRL
jgi:hypothetical protein